MHPGGPFWARRDAGAWSIPKGEVDAGRGRSAPARCASCEEETGAAFDDVGRRRAAAAWRGASEERQGRDARGRSKATSTPTRSSASTFELEWPPRSGRLQTFPGGRPRCLALARRRRARSCCPRRRRSSTLAGSPRESRVAGSAQIPTATPGGRRCPRPRCTPRTARSCSSCSTTTRRRRSRTSASWRTEASTTASSSTA